MIIRILISTLAALPFLAATLFAVPAAPDPHQGRTVAGESFQFTLIGDEFASWVETEDGHTLLMDHEKVWRHAVATPDGGLQAGPVAYLADGSGPEASRGLTPTRQWLRDHVGAMREQRNGDAVRSERVEGQWNLVVILIRYPDQIPQVGPAGFDGMMNQSGWHGTGSFNDYYTQLSYGRFSTVSVVTSWYTAQHEHDYYGYNQDWVRSRELVYEAVLAADGDVDFSQFDNDGNGVVDALLVVHSGHGAEEGDYSNIWSHRWGLGDLALDLDGVIINDYTMQPELQGGSQSAIGVYVHEFGHALNLPDLYDTDYSSSGVGSWCVMSGGSWGGGAGGNAHVPVSFSAFCRSRLGWATITTLDVELVNHGLPALHLSDEIVRLDLPGWPNQYFLAENRQLAAWDRHQPAAGLHIWHVDESMGGNSDEEHFLVDLEQADGFRSLNHGGGADSGDIFPGSSNNRRFDSDSEPSSRPYGDMISPVSIIDIGDAADTLFATYIQYLSHQDLRWEGSTVSQDDSGDQWPDPGESVRLAVQLFNHGGPLDSLWLELESAHEGIVVLEGQMALTPVDAAAPFTTPGPGFLLELDPTLAPGRYPLLLHTRDEEGWVQDVPGSIQVGRTDVLVYLDGVDEEPGTWYQQALGGLGLQAELRSRGAGLSPPLDMEQYLLVFWVTATASSPLSSSDVLAIDDFLAQGGQLLLSGQHVLEGVPLSGRELLGVDPGTAWNGSPQLRGISNGGLLADQEVMLLSGDGGAWNQEIPATTLLPRAGSTAVARWGNGQQCAVMRREWPAQPSPGRLILAGCSLEALHGATTLLSLEQVLERFVAWLHEGELTGIEPVAPFAPQVLDLHAWPNPFNPATTLGFSLSQPDQLRLGVWNLLGEQVISRDLGMLAAGEQRVHLNLEHAASGFYFVELTSATGQVRRTRVMLLR